MRDSASPSSSSSLDSSLKGLKSSSSSPELTDLKLSSLSASFSDSSDWLSSELLPDSPPDLRGFFTCFLTSAPGPGQEGGTHDIYQAASLSLSLIFLHVQ